MNSLRDISPGDQEAIRIWRNDPDVRKYMYTDHEISPDEHRAWFSRILRDSSCKYWIIVCDREDVGLLYLYDIDMRNRHCYWGFYTVGPQVRGKGIGSFAEFSVLRIVFDELQLQKLCGEVLAFNLPVLNMHKKFGFVQEGVFRKHVLKGDDFEDVVCISILREEWEAKKAELELKLRAKGVI
ncbi:MAG: UDP-4-amino-4,6-dideoxy-N-acetyl-beta-L-altrosamine N-acetyltransferase [Candidatus Sulfotelmatobacter sp.]